MKFRILTFVILFLALFLPAITKSENWPNWRGPNGDGTSTETGIPTKWDASTNVLWKIAIPGTGYASPVVWSDRLFTMTAKAETQEKILLCYDTKKGDLVWQTTVLKAPFESKHNDNSFASGTPATDGKYIYVSVLNGDSVIVAAYDFNGKQVWISSPGTFSSPHGYCCSPLLYKDKVIINGNSMGDSFAAALSQADGHTIWKVPHSRPAHSFSTPIIREMAGRTQMIFLGNKEVASYNPDNGTRYWWVDGPSEDFTASPVYNEKTGLVLISSAWPKRTIFAIRPDGSGDVANTHLVWKSVEGAYYVPSPVTTGDYMISSMITGYVYCIEAATGKILWKENLGKQYASSVLVNGLVYNPNDEGVITVIKPSPTFEAVSKNSIGEPMFASPAISNGRIYLRGTKHLFCIGTK
jgi:outer membrane protein assembly factor BamB